MNHKNFNRKPIRPQGFGGPMKFPLAQAVDRRVGSNKRHSPVFELAKTRGFARLSPEICRWFKICCAGSYRSSFL